MKGLLRILPLLLLLVHPGLSHAEDPVFSWIKTGQTENIENWLEDQDINTVDVETGLTLLIYSIIHGEPKITSLLIEKGADVNLAVSKMSPLMYAAGGDYVRNLDKLIDAGADIEAVDRFGNTALFYAAGNTDLRICKHLIRRGGANSLHQNDTYQTAYDIAVQNNNSEIARYLRAHFEKNLPDYQDGPYVYWKGKGKIISQYLVHDSKSQITRRSKAVFKADADPYKLKGFAGDSLDYLIHSRKEVPADLITDANRVMVIGDIHGGYDSLVIFLKKNGVINSSLQWTWNDGHLVFVGDIFDRGEGVTEALWLIYQLEYQAALDGGSVHLILGNHEILVLSGDLHYIAEKYRLMTDKLNLDYSYLYNKRTVLGQWLRTKNTIIRINGHLFVHAGLSPQILECGIDIHEINEAVRFFLMHPDRKEFRDISRSNLMGHNGPFWYRGYIEDNHTYAHLPEPEFEKVLEYFDAEYIIIGHTNVKEITPLYSKRVFAVDVPFYSLLGRMEGLLLEGENVYVLNSSANKKQIR